MSTKNEQKQEFLFEKINYKILLIGIAVIALGFILMSGEVVMIRTFLAKIFLISEEYV